MMTPNDLTRFRTSVLLVQLTFQLTLGHEVQFVLHSLHQYAKNVTGFVPLSVSTMVPKLPSRPVKFMASSNSNKYYSVKILINY